MLAQIRKLLAAPESSQEGPDQLQIAVAVLLVEAARMDDHFDDAERAVIERLHADRRPAHGSAAADTSGRDALGNRLCRRRARSGRRRLAPACGGSNLCLG